MCNYTIRLDGREEGIYFYRHASTSTFWLSDSMATTICRAILACPRQRQRGLHNVRRLYIAANDNIAGASEAFPMEQFVRANEPEQSFSPEALSESLMTNPYYEATAQTLSPAMLLALCLLFMVASSLSAFDSFANFLFAALGAHHLLSFTL